MEIAVGQAKGIGNTMFQRSRGWKDGSENEGQKAARWLEQGTWEQWTAAAGTRGTLFSES